MTPDSRPRSTRGPGPREPVVRWLSRRPAVAAGTAAVAGLMLVGVWLRCGPIEPGLLDLTATQSTVVVDRRGVPLYEALSGDGTRSVHLVATALPPNLVAATVAAEDRRFWTHPGVDPLAIARAARHNLAERAIVEGGSTITQQVAKLLLNRQEPRRVRGFAEKIREAVLALRLEHRHTKREILAIYLNLASYGNQIVGASRASLAYFSQDPSLLTPAQAAFLAGLPQRPSTFNPYRRLEAAIARQRVVIRRMEAMGVLGSAQAAEARNERLALTRGQTPFLAPHLVEMALAAAGGTQTPTLETTIDAALQADIAGIIRSHRAALDRHGAHNVAVVVLDNARGEWLAWEGSGDYFDAEHGGTINGPATPRQPGSALKPFIYALAFEEGATPATVLADVPSHFPTADPGVLYSPRNYDGRFRGPLLARRALAGSGNVPAVALASTLGVPRLQRFLTRAGLSTLDRTPAHYGLGLTLGNAEVRLDELVGAYASFARGGRWVEPTWRRDPGAARQQRPLVSPATAWWITDILSDGEAREFIFGRGGSLEFAFPVAVKTGTSQAYHDNWTIGYSRDVTVGVWVGNFDRTPLRASSGVTGAAPIFHAVMLAAMNRLHGANPSEHAPIATRPAGLHERRICGLSGMRANPWCPARRSEWLPAGEEQACSWHHQSDDGVLVFWPAEYRQWAGDNGLPGEGTVQFRPISGESRPRPSGSEAAPARLQIVNPPGGATYLIDPTLRREFQTLPLRVVAPDRGSIDWRVNGRPAGTAASDRAVMWPLSPGTHRITARDQRGRTAEATIVVR